jgi:hypothetical protein
MRRLLPVLALSLVLLACGGASQPTAAARSRVSTRLSTNAALAARHASARGCARVELETVAESVSSGKASLGWAISSTVDVKSFQIEAKPAGGRWKKYAEAAVSARSATLRSLPDGPSEFRVWALLKQGTSAASTGGSGAIAVGLDAGFWGTCEPYELRTAVGYVRLDTPTTIAPWTRAGLKVIADESGPYDSSGVSGLDASAYVKRVVSFVEANPEVWAVEVLNEPGGPWFWGERAESQANRAAYANLIIAVHEALVARFGAKRPLILASYDGGDSSSTAWGQGWAQNKSALADADMLTMHPYGGTEDRAKASLGERANVAAAHAQTGKPIAITEVGFPTEQATSDSMLYSEAEQAKNVAGVVAWASKTGYVKAITIYGFRDGEPGGPGYGLETYAGRRKPAFSALVHASIAAES